MALKSAIVILASLGAAATAAMALDLRDISYDTQGAGKVVFSHKTHLNRSIDGSKMSCKSCHDSSAKATPHYRMKEMEQGKSCGKCHDGKQAFSVGNCTACHKVKEISFRVKETGPVQFSHNRHLKAMQCNACHDAIYKTGPNKRVGMAQMERGKSCGACHNGSKAFSLSRCDACHPSPKEVVFKVKETGPTLFSHDRHVALYGCGSCHTKLYRLGAGKPVPMAAMERGKSCGACHNGKSAFAVSKCQKCHPVREVRFKVARAGDVSFSHKAHLDMYRCKDCHTRTFPARSGNRPVSMSEMKKAKSCGACHDGKAAFGVTGNCDSCHLRRRG